MTNTDAPASGPRTALEALAECLHHTQCRNGAGWKPDLPGNMDRRNASGIIKGLAERGYRIIEAEAAEGRRSESALREALEAIRKAHAFIGGITPDEWAAIDKAIDARQHLESLEQARAALTPPPETRQPEEEK